MLISGNTVVVIGYSYQRGGTEVGLFDITDDGHLSYRSTYHLRSNDYYSSRNYASRLIGNKLIFYAPQYLWYGQPFSRFLRSGNGTRAPRRKSSNELFPQLESTARKRVH